MKSKFRHTNMVGVLRLRRQRDSFMAKQWRAEASQQEARREYRAGLSS